MAAPEQKQSARRAIRLLWILQGNTFDGLRLKQIAEQLDTTQSTALRDLEMLAEEGVAERIPGREEFWRLTPKLIQLARAHDVEMTRLRARVDEIDQRYTRSPL
ncbi:helix-turn-helix domain-containing protein [Oryzomicrobium sp.]|uniref:helix-turn-helix domain-containing protein n=1 Tax=Oryzomicrobium sp. TaxID=1911578 RepID=UPI002FE1067F